MGSYHLNDSLENLESLLIGAGLNAKRRNEALVDWQQTACNVQYLSVDYSIAMVDYQIAYWSGNHLACKDISLVLMHDNRPCGLWPLSATCEVDGQWRIGSNGGPLLPPLFIAGFSRKSVKSVIGCCLIFIESLCAQIGQFRFDSFEPFAGGAGLSEWHDRLMQGGAKAALQHDLYIDLSQSLADIKSGFRKSYKSLITSGSKLWNVQIIKTSQPMLWWDEFRLLHRAVAGRVTRTEESWRLQHEAIASGDAFFVFLRDDAGRMVGGALFHVTKHEALYAVGAYDRSLFDKPLGHVVQYHAIMEMKRRGIRWYKIGARVYSGDTPQPSDKEFAISHFKQGFSSHLFPRFLLRNELKHSKG